MSLSRDVRRGVLLMLAAGLIWPAIEHSAFALMHTHPPMQIVFLRYLGHLLVLVPLVLLRRGARAFRTERPFLQLLRGLCMFAMPACFVLGSQLGSSRWVWTLFWSMPALTWLGAVLFQRERPHAGGAIAAAFGLLGAGLLFGGEAGPASTVLGIAMAGSVAAYMLLSRVLRHEPLAASLLYTSVGAIVPTALVAWRIWTPLVPLDIVGVVLVGVLSVLILAAFDLSLEAAPAGIVVPVLALVPVWELLLGDVLRQTLPGTRELAGMAVILAGFAALFLLSGGTTGRRFAASRQLSLEEQR